MWATMASLHSSARMSSVALVPGVKQLWPLVGFVGFRMCQFVSSIHDSNAALALVGIVKITFGSINLKTYLVHLNYASLDGYHIMAMGVTILYLEMVESRRGTRTKRGVCTCCKPTKN